MCACIFVDDITQSRTTMSYGMHSSALVDDSKWFSCQQTWPQLDLLLCHISKNVLFLVALVVNKRHSLGAGSHSLSDDF